VSYLVVDAANDAILAECESATDLLPTLAQVEQERPEREVVLVSFDEHRGEVVGTQALATVRTLTDSEKSALYGQKRLR
jgi:hypothetical protein